MKFSQIFPGGKTYTVMVGAVVATVAMFMQDQIDIGQAINQIFLAVGAMTIRAGIKHDSGK